jgi:hypothetical protein
MNVKIGTEASQFLFGEYINDIFVAVPIHIIHPLHVWKLGAGLRDGQGV